MRLVKATKRILEAKQNITPRLVERCLVLTSKTLSRRIGKTQVWAPSIVIPGCEGTFDIFCAVPGEADQSTPFLHLFHCEDTTARIDAGQLISSFKNHYGSTRLRLSPTGRGGWIQYRSSRRPERTVMYLINFEKRDPNRKAFGGILIANLHRR